MTAMNDIRSKLTALAAAVLASTLSIAVATIPATMGAAQPQVRYIVEA